VVLEGSTLYFKDGQRGRVLKERTLILKGAVCKTPVLALKGQELKQPPLISSLIDKQRFPFSLMWPQGEVNHDVTLATATSADRAGWTKALNKKLNELKAQAPTEGWLMKKSGRKGNTGFGLSGIFTAGWKRRWFVLVQPEEDVEGSFRYFATPTDKDALGAVVLNKDANLYVAGDESNKPNSFCITSQGIHDPKPITTVLACKTNQDLQRWMKAVRRAVSTSGGEVQSAKRMAEALEAHDGKLKKVSKETANLIALSKLDREDLAEVKLKKLYEIAAYMCIQLPPEVEPKVTKKIKDKRELEYHKDTLVELIRAKNMEIESLASQDTERFGAPKKGKRVSVRGRGESGTWESDSGMGGGGGATKPDMADARPAKNGAMGAISRRISEAPDEAPELM